MRLHARLVGFSILAAFLFPMVAHAEGIPLTLDEALALALANNERAQKTPPRVEAAKGAVDRARSAFLPTLVAQGIGGWGSVPDRGGRNLSGNGTVTFNQPILNPSAFPLYGQAKHALASEQWGAVEDLRLLAFDTTTAYLSALLNDQLLTAAEQRRDRAKSDMDDAAARAEAGLTSTNDVTRDAIALATAESQVATAQGNVSRAYLALAYLIGQPIKSGLAPVASVTSEANKNAWSVEQVIRDAQDRRPDVKAAAEHATSLWDFAREPLYRLVPTAGLTGQVRQAVSPLPPDPVTSETAQLTLTWTIYDAGVRYADRRTRLAQAQSASLDEHALRRTVATDISVAIALLNAARDVLRIEEGAVVSAKKSAEETAILYKQGLAKAIEVTDANASLYDAEVTRASAQLSMQQAYLNLRYALGLGPTSETLSTPANVPGAHK